MGDTTRIGNIQAQALTMVAVDQCNKHKTRCTNKDVEMITATSSYVLRKLYRAWAVDGYVAMHVTL